MNWENQIKGVGITSIIIGVLVGVLSTFQFVKSDLFTLEGGLGIILAMIVTLPLTIALIASGIGLMKHKKWARDVLIILSVLGIIGFIGSIYSIIFTKAVIKTFSGEVGSVEIIGSTPKMIPSSLSLIIATWFLIILLNKKTKELMK